MSDISVVTEIMKILLINPPYQTLTSNLGVGHQVPLGLLMIGGALIDAGHEVKLLDAECLALEIATIADLARAWAPQVVMTGHAGSTPAHPVCMKLLAALRLACPQVVTVYGGVYPTYHAEQILREHPAVDYVVRGEGEATVVGLVSALEKVPPEKRKHVCKVVNGLAFHDAGEIHFTPPRPPIADLDDYRIGWELIDDWDRYHCFGLGRAAIIQLSRGCPHRCTYCGQHGFWVRWRYRDPERVAQELEWLRTTHKVRFITLADENPTTLPDVWEGFLRAVARRKLGLHFFSTIRATDIVRDEAILPLYREAGLLYILMGVDTTEPRLQRKVRKHSTVAADRRAAHLLRKNGVFAMLGHIVGFEDDTWLTHWRTLRSLLRYDADFLNAMYVTPHSWTEFAHESAHRCVIQPNLIKWDYRHQVLGEKHLRPWQVFLAVKLTELVFHIRPARWAAFFSGSRFQQRQLLWCLWHTGLVWLGEIASFFMTRTLPLAQASRLAMFHAHARAAQLPLLRSPARKRPAFPAA